MLVSRQGCEKPITVISICAPPAAGTPAGGPTGGRSSAPLRETLYLRFLRARRCPTATPRLRVRPPSLRRTATASRRVRRGARWTHRPAMAHAEPRSTRRGCEKPITVISICAPPEAGTPAGGPTGGRSSAPLRETLFLRFLRARRCPTATPRLRVRPPSRRRTATASRRVRRVRRVRGGGGGSGFDRGRFDLLTARGRNSSRRAQGHSRTRSATPAAVSQKTPYPTA
jgi:hypothetical protein